MITNKSGFYWLSYLCLVLMGSSAVQAGELREFYIKTVHIDGNANIKGDDKHPAEAFVTEGLPEGRGLQITKPNEYGAWKIRAFTFTPSQMVVREGDDVRLHFIGVQGLHHGIHVEGNGVDEKFTLTRGVIKTIDFKSVKEGSIEIECYDHLPLMTAEVLVLP